jgi:hypothetical protein
MLTVYTKFGTPLFGVPAMIIGVLYNFCPCQNLVLYFGTRRFNIIGDCDKHFGDSEEISPIITYPSINVSWCQMDSISIMISIDVPNPSEFDECQLGGPKKGKDLINVKGLTIVPERSIA